MVNKIFTKNQAIEEASLCLLCYDAPCSKNCPTGTNPSSFIRSIRFGNFYEAAKKVRQNNILGLICAKICPSHKYCKQGCIRRKIDRSIQINKLQEFALNFEKGNNQNLLKEKNSYESKYTAIIGTTPMGLSCAAELVKNGFPARIFYKYKSLETSLNYTFNTNRLTLEDIAQDIAQIKKLGVKFEASKQLGKNLNIKYLWNANYEAIFIATELDLLHTNRKTDPELEKLNFSNNRILNNNYCGVTNIEGIYTSNKNVNPDKDIAKSIQEGKKTAEEIIKYLSNKTSYKDKTNNIRKEKYKNLEVDFCGIKCENPFFLASAPVAGNYEMCARALKKGWGGIVFKTIGKSPVNECSPRFDNISKESTPFIGFKNMEQTSEEPLEKNLSMIKSLKKDFPDKVIVVSIMGSTEKEWKELSELATEAGADLLECNFSCPQMTSSEMGVDVGQDPDIVEKYTKAVRSKTSLPIIAKMTPNIGNIEIPAEAAVKGGADSIAAINTIKSITGIDLNKKCCKPVINRKSSISGYSGKAIKPIALRFITELATYPKTKHIPISGIGGIESWHDVAEFIMVGASNIQIATAVMQYGYRIIDDIKSGISHYLNDNGFNNLQEMVGVALPNIVPANQIDRNYILQPNFNENLCVGCGRCYISCNDGGHQAINWNYEKRVPELNNNCVGCMLCKEVCPIENCITYGEIKYK